jgi:hypothetical protein
MPIKEILKKGYEGFNVPDDFKIPPCGIEDVDRAVFELFDKRLAFEVKVNEQTTKVPVVFAAGERFALTKRLKPIRDKNNALVLPLIALKFKQFSIVGNEWRYAILLMSLLLLLILKQLAVPLIIILYVILSVLQNSLSKTKTPAH